MENVCYEALYAVLQDRRQHEATSTALKQLKAKIVRLHNNGLRRVLLDKGEHEKLVDEGPTL